MRNLRKQYILLVSGVGLRSSSQRRMNLTKFRVRRRIEERFGQTWYTYYTLILLPASIRHYVVHIRLSLQVNRRPASIAVVTWLSHSSFRVGLSLLRHRPFSSLALLVVPLVTAVMPVLDSPPLRLFWIPLHAYPLESPPSAHHPIYSCHYVGLSLPSSCHVTHLFHYIGSGNRGHHP